MRRRSNDNQVPQQPDEINVIKGDDAAQKKALDAGFADCVEKPFDSTKTEATLYKVMGLDSSARYFKFKEDFLLFTVPSILSDFVINDIKDNMDFRIKNTINEGITKLVIDVSGLEEVEEV